MSNILPYTQEAFAAYYSHTFIEGFNHKPLADGETEPTKADLFVAALNHFSEERRLGVAFNPEHGARPQLTGGACTAISLQVAKEGLDILEKLEQLVGISAYEKAQILQNLVRKVVNTISLEKKKEVHRQVRTIQQAFNAIAVNRDDRQIQPLCNHKTATLETYATNPDFQKVAQDKIKALSAFFGLTVLESQAPLLVASDPKVEKKMLTQMKGLINGVYLLRIIKYQYNHKLEEKGHSVVYITTPHLKLYFDPALGCHLDIQEPGQINVVYQALLSANAHFGVDLLQIHQLVKADNRFEEILQTVRGTPTIALTLPTIVSAPLTGYFKVGTKSFTCENTSRTLEINLYYPAESTGSPSYKILQMTPKGQTVRSHSETDGSLIRRHSFPLIFFSPGLGSSPDDYVHLVEQIASHGYFVASVNETSRTRTKKLSEEEIIHEGLEKAGDLIHVIDKVQKGEVKGFSDHFGDSFDASSIAVIGHSLGGSAAFEACRLLPAIRCAINLDGRIIQRKEPTPFGQPALLITAGQPNEDRAEFEAAFAACKEQNPQISTSCIQNAAHGDFSLASCYRLKDLHPQTDHQKAVTMDTLQLILSFLKENMRVAP